MLQLGPEVNKSETSSYSVSIFASISLSLSSRALRTFGILGSSGQSSRFKILVSFFGSTRFRHWNVLRELPLHKVVQFLYHLLCRFSGRWPYTNPVKYVFLSLFIRNLLPSLSFLAAYCGLCYLLKICCMCSFPIQALADLLYLFFRQFAPRTVFRLILRPDE
jgi:hypothetical protein